MTLRALIVGIFCVLILGVGIPYSDLVMKGTWVGLTAFPISSFAMLFLLTVGVNGLLRWMGRGLESRELLLIYAMTLVAAGIPSFGLTGLLIPYLAGPFYFASPENRWAEILHPYIPSWLACHDRQAVKYLYEGLPKGSPIPWNVWFVPLLSWTALALCVYLVFFGLSTILRRQWVENEKLVFPLVQLPVQMCRYETSSLSALPPFFHNKIMWTFFSLPFFIHAVNGLHFHFPVIPYLNVHLIPLGSYFPDPPWNQAFNLLWLRLPFSIVGLSYLLPTELSFSLWFFYFFFLAQMLVGASFGFPMPSVQAYPVRQFVAHQMIGGIIVCGLYGLWGMRGHLSGVLRKALSGSQSVDDTKEPFPFRLAVAGVVVGLVGICLWGQLAGAGWLATFVIFTLYFHVHIVAVRLVCEGGMLYVQHPFRPLNIMLSAFGSARLGAQRIAILTYFDHLFMVDNRSPLMPCIMQGLRLTETEPVALNRRHLTYAMMVSVLLAMLSSYWSYLRLMYKYGGQNLHFWFTTYYTRNLYCTWTSQLISVGEPPSPKALATMLAGGATIWGIISMHRNFLWWPFHPIGYLMGASWPMINFWFPIFLGWLIKSLILKFGGPRVYRELTPGFLGFILAEFFSAGMWVVIDFLAGVKGHEIFSF